MMMLTNYSLPDEGEESEEEKLKKETRERAKQEFFAALQLEGMRNHTESCQNQIN